MGSPQRRAPAQGELEGMTAQPDIAAVVAKTVDLVARHTIAIPRILVMPKGEVKSGFKPFTLELDTLKCPAVSDELWIQHLRTHQLEVVTLGRGGGEEARLEDYIVSGLVDFDDISYDDHAALLYDLAAQTVRHFRGYLSDAAARKVPRCYQRPIAQFIHAQIQAHYWEDAAGHEVKISKDFTELKPSAYTCAVREPPADYRLAPAGKSNMAQYLFGGFQRCLYPVQKFDPTPSANSRSFWNATPSSGSGRPGLVPDLLPARGGSHGIPAGLRCREHRYPLQAGTQGQQPDGGCGRARQAGIRAPVVRERFKPRDAPWRKAVALPADSAR
jgi:hypothetical protein